jgi:hypothetical protein
MGMDDEQEQRHSFVVTIWREDAPSEHPNEGWRGHITHVQSGDRHYLIKLDDLVTFIAACMGAPDSWLARKGLLGRWWPSGMWLTLARPRRLAAAVRKQTGHHPS